MLVSYPESPTWFSGSGALQSSFMGAFGIHTGATRDDRPNLSSNIGGRSLKRIALGTSVNGSSLRSTGGACLPSGNAKRKMNIRFFKGLLIFWGKAEFFDRQAPVMLLDQ